MPLTTPELASHVMHDYRNADLDACDQGHAGLCDKADAGAVGYAGIGM